jgi:signal transduction histidine kinase
MISHEIRTPLTSIKGFVEILSSQELSPLHRRYVDLTHSSCAALMAVVDDVLDFSKIESGQIDLHPVPVSLAQLTHSALSSVLGTAGPKGLSLAVEIAPDVPPSLLADPDRLRQILLNLLTNAVKFTLRGSVTLLVTHEGTAPDGERVRFAVIDTGIGIPENRLERLFNRFSQVDQNIRYRFGGTGLGLAICKQLVERMGARSASTRRWGADRPSGSP